MDTVRRILSKAFPIMLLVSLFCTMAIGTSIAQEGTSEKAITRLSWLNVRSGPGTNYAVISAVPQGTELAVLGRNTTHTWLNVCCVDGQEGWISANSQYVDVVSVQEQTQSSLQSPPAQHDINRSAKQIRFAALDDEVRYLRVEGRNRYGIETLWENTYASGITIVQTEDYWWEGTVILFFHLKSYGWGSCIVEDIDGSRATTTAFLYVTFSATGGCNGANTSSVFPTAGAMERAKKGSAPENPGEVITEIIGLGNGGLIECPFAPGLRSCLQPILDALILHEAITVAPTPVATPTSTPPPVPQISFRSDSATLNLGECTTLRWNVENVREVYLDDQGVEGNGTLRICPANTQTFSLKIIRQDGGQDISVVTIVVNGTNPVQRCVASGDGYFCTITATAGWQQTPFTIEKDTAYSIWYKGGTWTVSVNTLPNVGRLPYVGWRGYPHEVSAQIPGQCNFYPGTSLQGELMFKTDERIWIPGGDNTVNGLISGSRGNNDLVGVLSMRINDKDECLSDNDGSITVEISRLSPSAALEDSKPKGAACGQFIRITQSEEKPPAFQPSGTNEVWIIDPSAFFYLEDKFQEGSFVRIEKPEFGEDSEPAWGYSRVRHLTDSYDETPVFACDTGDSGEVTSQSTGTVCGQFIRVNQSIDKWPAFQPFGASEIWIIDPSIFTNLADVFQEGSYVQIVEPVVGGDWEPAWGYSRIRSLTGDSGIERVSACEATNPPTQQDPKGSVIASVGSASISTEFPQQTNQLADALFAHLPDFGQTGGGISQDAMREALQREDVGMRINAVVQGVWGSWVSRAQQAGLDPIGTDPSAFDDISPFRRLIIHLIQGTQSTLSQAEQQALYSLLTRKEDTETWRDNMNAIVGAINRESFPVEQPTVTTPPTPVPVPTPQEPVQPAGQGPLAITPQDGTVLRCKPKFVWQDPVGLPPGHIYEIVFWKPGEDWTKGRGATSADLRTNRDIDLNYLDDKQDWFAPGDYEWGILDITTEPYTRHRLIISGGRFTFVRDGTCS